MGRQFRLVFCWLAARGGGWVGDGTGDLAAVITTTLCGSVGEIHTVHRPSGTARDRFPIRADRDMAAIGTTVHRTIAPRCRVKFPATVRPGDQTTLRDAVLRRRCPVGQRPTRSDPPSLLQSPSRRMVQSRI